MTNKIILVGNPNTGKTTLFNTIAKTHEHVGNWHGVTVEYKEKKLKLNNKEILLVDLPGIYSLSSYSFEEAVARDYLLKNKTGKIINICDANNLSRNLLLTLELLEMGFRPILCINMANELKKSGKKVDIQKLEKLLGIKVFLIDAQNKIQVKQVVNYALENDENGYHKLNYLNDLCNIFDNLKLKYFFKKDIDVFSKIKILEQDDFFINKCLINKENLSKINDILYLNKTLDLVIQQKYLYVDNIIEKTVSHTKNTTYGYSKLDNFILNKWLCFPIFLIVLCLVFYLTFGPVGTFLSERISLFLDGYVFSPISAFIKKSTNNLFIINFISAALFGSVISLASFLPQIVLLFLGLYIIEDSGYMSRLAFTLEDFFKKIGLSGKSVFTLLMGFGCGTTASLTSRNLEDKNSKIKTAIITPYISCSAKLPLYALICNAFFPKIKFAIVVLLYLLGIAVALVVSAVLNKTILPSKKQSFIMELPPYRIPSAKKIIKNIAINIKQFLLRVGTVLLSFSCIVWIIENCNYKLQYQADNSILEVISKFIAPIFTPLGFGNYGAVACLLCGFVAKEIIVSTISMLNGCGSSNLKDISNSILYTSSIFCLNLPSSLSFLVFALLYAPCVSTVSVFVKEIGFKWTLFACVLEFLISYILSFITYKIALYFSFNGILSGVISIAIFVLITSLVCFALMSLKNKKNCKYCLNKCIKRK